MSRCVWFWQRFNAVRTLKISKVFLLIFLFGQSPKIGFLEGKPGKLESWKAGKPGKLESLESWKAGTMFFLFSTR